MVRVLDATGATVGDNPGSVIFGSTITDENWSVTFGQYTPVVSAPSARPFVLQVIDVPRLHDGSGFSQGLVAAQVVFDPVALGINSCASLPNTGISAPTVTFASPDVATPAGGTSVTITGTNLLGATAVAFGGTPATSFTVNSATSITATTPAHAAGAVDVTVTNFGGNGTGSGLFTFGTPLPTVTIVSPSIGSTAGGSSVTITGTNLTGATGVTFGGVAATSFTAVNATTVTATSPPHAAGVVDVAVTTPDGTGTGSNLFTYVVGPTIAAVSPNSGPTTGGTAVTIIGSDLTGASAVTFGGVAATSFAVVDAATVTATSPPHAAGAVDIVVTAASGTATGAGLYTYTSATTSGLVLTTAATPGKFSGVGQTIAFTYTVTNSAGVTVTGVSVSDSKAGPVTCAATTLATGASTTCTGSYTSRAADVNAAAITSIATAHATFGATSVASTAVTTTIEIDAEAVRRATRSAIQGFMSRRADMITSMGPDTGRMHDRLTGSLFGGGAANAPPPPAGLGGPRAAMFGARSGVARAGAGVGEAMARDRAAMTSNEQDSSGQGGPAAFGFAGSAEDGAGRFAFSTSLAKMRATAQAQNQNQSAGLQSGPMGLGASDAAPAAPSKFDMWTEAAFAYYSSNLGDEKRKGHAGLFFAGADYLVMPGLLVGAVVQLDWMNETSSALVRDADGRGWMAGPYISAQLTPNLFLDARALWGRSSNHIDPLGAYTDSFDTTRALTAAKLTGRWTHGALSFQPSAEIVYFKEEQKAYSNAIGIDIDGQSLHLGRLTFGPEVGYTMGLGDDGTFEPFVSLKGVWDFAKTDATTAAGEPVGHDAWRGRIEAGATIRTSSGIALRAQGSYDGLGDSHFQAWQGRATLVVPLQ